MRKILILAACAAFTMSSGTAFAAQQCRDDKGKFAKCGSPGAKTVG